MEYLFTKEDLELCAILLANAGMDAQVNEEDITDPAVRKTVLEALKFYDLLDSGRADIAAQRFHCDKTVNDKDLPREVIRDLRKKLKHKDPPRRMFISDLHFYHHALNRQMDLRGFKDFHEMNSFMIEQWNNKVRKNDEVFILGDLSIAAGKATNEIVSQLNGKLYLIEGNHDKKFLEDKEFNAERFLWIKPYAEIKDHGRKVILSHYPVFCYNGQYKMKDDAPYVYMLYGHVHNTYDEDLLNHFIMTTRQAKRQSKYDDEPKNIPCNMINCFCMFSNYQPLTLDEWIETDRKRREAMKPLERVGK